MRGKDILVSLNFLCKLHLQFHALEYTEGMRLFLLILVMSHVGCSPMGMGPPPTQIPSGYNEELGSTVGVGVQIDEQNVEQLLLDESLWYRKRLGEKSELQFIGGAIWNGDPIVYGAVGFRRYFTTADGGQFGIDIKVSGPFFAEIGIPLQRQLGDKNVWLTSHPSYGINGFGAAHVPVGLIWQPRDKWLLNTSVGTRFVGLNPQLWYWNGGFYSILRRHELQTIPASTLQALSDGSTIPGHSSFNKLGLRRSLSQKGKVLHCSGRTS